MVHGANKNLLAAWLAFAAATLPTSRIVVVIRPLAGLFLKELAMGFRLLALILILGGGAIALRNGAICLWSGLSLGGIASVLSFTAATPATVSLRLPLWGLSLPRLALRLRDLGLVLL